MTTTLVRRTAKELAGAFYDQMDVFQDGRVERSARFRQECTDQKAFIKKHWPDFVKTARKVLAHMLHQPGTPQSQKDAIYDALLEERGFATDETLAAPSILRLN